MADDLPDPIEDPFTQLVREHRDIEARVALLARAANETRDEARRATALQTIADVLGYFDGPAAIHHAHEEQTLFPQLRPLEAFAQMLAAFEFQHQLVDATYVELCAAFRAYTPGDPSKLRTLAHRFAEMQRAHMIAEERGLFPLAARTLSPETIRRIRDEMTARCR